VFTDYGVVEVNTSRHLVIKVQNASLAAACIDSIEAPPGFQVIATNPVLPTLLGTTRILQITLRFLPTAQTQYDGELKIFCHCPCAVVESTEVKGVGAVLDISFPWTTIVLPQATPCDTVYRDVVLGNPSHRQITINSITITGPNANAFSWQGVNFNGVPTVVDSLSDDTIRFYFYAGNTPLMFTSATLTLIATTIAGQDTFVVILSGSKKLQYVPSDDSISFGAIAVRSPAATQNLTMYNALPAGNVVIDSVYLVPDVGVFKLTYPPLPVTLAPGDSLPILVDFTPKAAVFYEAHIAVHVASPCPDLDSSIVVTGSGFTPVVLINMCFDTAAVTKIGDEFTLPIIADRLIPQTPVDMTMILNYDVRAVRLESVLAADCATSNIVYTNTGVIISLKTCVNVDSGAICFLQFRALVPDSVIASIALDSIAFSNDTVALPSLLAQGCGTTATIDPNCCITYLNSTGTASALSQNAPNPVADVATIEYQTTEDTRVQVRIFDMLGRGVATPVDAFEKHGDYALQFDTRPLKPGMYYYTIDAGVFHAARMMSVVR
ncbi:MAG TPA: T9SS type A sorting domain-containing protein, partial [Candidatus Kapabacteria bacterium]|nr:T9SS type A sorting domain-containing protein [Candidatus Kapabacteria bacterium]